MQENWPWKASPFGRKSPARLPVRLTVRYLAIIAVGAILIWLGSLLWQMLQSTGHTFWSG
jgi:hypothetical protein